VNKRRLLASRVGGGRNEQTRQAKIPEIEATEDEAWPPDLDHSRSAVLDSLSSPESKRGYRHAIDEFIQWYCSEPRLSFNKTLVTRYRIYLENRHLAAEPLINDSLLFGVSRTKLPTLACSAPNWLPAFGV
jgi:hypothetical protein